MVDLFILLMLLFLWCWDYPLDHPCRFLIHLPGLPLAWIGLWHGWAMFAPEPIHINRRLRAILTFENGSQQVWSPLSPSPSTKLLNALYARSFKFEYSMFSFSMQAMYQPLCEFLIRQATESGRSVRSVELIRESRLVNSWEKADVYSPPVQETFYRFDATRAAGELLSEKKPEAQTLPA